MLLFLIYYIAFDKCSIFLSKFKTKRHCDEDYEKPITQLDFGTCKYCTDRVKEDEKHLRMRCEFYSDLHFDLHAQAKHIEVNLKKIVNVTSNTFLKYCI